MQKHAVRPATGRSARLAGAAALAFMVAGPAPAYAAGVLLCADAGKTLKRDRAMAGAVAAAFSGDIRIQSAADADKPDAQPCESLTALLRFGTSAVLITAHPESLPVGHPTAARLSAFFLAPEGKGYRLLSEKRDFAPGANGWGDAGDVNKARFGADDGMVVSGSYTGQGETSSAASFYVFRDGGIVPLGQIATGWDNSGAMEDASKAVSVDGTFVAGKLGADSVKIVYTRTEGRKKRRFETVWRSRDGKFTLESGTLPEEIRQGEE